MTKYNIKISPVDFDLNKLALFLSIKPGFSWLDSASHGSFSILAFNPIETKVFYNKSDKNAFQDFLKSISQNSSPSINNLNFTGGWIGYMSYESYSLLDNIPFLNDFQKNYPLAQFSYYDHFFYFNHFANQLYFVSPKDNHNSFLDNFIWEYSNFNHDKLNSDFKLSSPLKLSTDSTRYTQDIQAIKTSLENGDYFELNYTTEFCSQFKGSSFSLYEKFRTLHPSPMMAYLNFNDLNILSGSPEVFFKIENSNISTYPIKGTIKNSRNLQENEILKTKLFQSEKNRSELLMVTDLLRNDLGKISTVGSVTLNYFAKPYSFSFYHHLISKISSQLKPDLNYLEIFQALFPGGSITGAPKIKVMEHIQMLEKHPRGVYTGAIGYISNNGSSQFNIPIRTMVIHKEDLEFSVGGGIVYDSTVKDEFLECLTKAKGMLSCFDYVENDFL